MWQWTENVEQYVLDVIFERRRDWPAQLTSGALLGLSKLYETGVQIRLFLWRHRIFRDHTLGCQVVSIGNLSVGGTGKTPVVEVFARALQQRGRRVAILSRGYKSVPRPLWQRILAKITFRKTGSRPRSSRMAGRCCSTATRPATSLTCWRPTSKTSSCWWTRTA